jgi:hypothetical protein
VDPIKWKSKIILVKPEVTYATDSAPTAALNAMLLTDVQLQPMEGEDVSRNLERPFMGAQEELATALRVVLSGSIELVGSGTPGVAPAWAPMLRACGVAEVITVGTSVEYTPVSEGHESVVAHVQIGPWRHVLLGGRGTATITVNAQGIPVARVVLTGLFVLPADQARPTNVNLSAFQRPDIVTKANTPTFTIAGLPFVMRSYELNLACDVQPRMLVGFEGIIIVDRNETLTATVEGVPYATYNPYQRALEGTPTPVVLQHGKDAGRIVTIRLGQAKQRRPSGIVNNQNIAEWALGFNVLPTDAGNDQWKITLT